MDSGALRHLELRVDDLEDAERSFDAGSRVDVDAIVAEAPQRAWTLRFPDWHPFASGDGHYAAHLENDDGFEVERVACP